ncbi:MAG: cobalt ECF transporter T component CbiQ [Deferribacteraceae bacterium]|jgi:cobalt/nickel transport system permease protein|nr:cobalt ECF transporter T component CbiQ [Deferribacteraceae bacterium]
MPSLFSAGADIRSMESLAEGDSVIHRLPPMAKLVTTLVYVVMVVSFNRYNLSGLIPYAVYPIILISLSQTPYNMLLKRLVIAMPFALFGGAANIFFDRDVAFTIASIAVTYGVVSFLSIMMKTVLTVATVLILISTTRISDISDSLVRLKVPPLFVLSLMMTYRYISVLLEEAGTMYTAYSLRSPNVKGVKIGDMGVFVGQLMIRSLDRAERIYAAMKCRGFNSIYHAGDSQTVGVRYIACVCGALLVLRFINLSELVGNGVLR